ncbi:FimB/Mfa2 family fimbrial subunit [Porphyromonas bennonis]|uniref:FimB/Mfa2 family fimbrial subunit n=1 Tax=Porphyromonas bennonis TaxID=501496 RepID=UPI00138AFF90|nr:FimB/Mfa2 family fimbrial subunit [Porphyromonas bennonis]
MRKRLLPITIVTSLLAMMGLLLTSCHPCVYEDLSDCPQIVRLQMQYADPCGGNVTDKYAPLAKGHDFRVMAFRTDGSRVKLELPDQTTPPTTESAFYDVVVREYGKFTFVTLLAEDFTPYRLDEVISIDQLLLALETTPQTRADLPEIWYGISDKYDNTDYASKGTVTDTLLMGMEEKLHTLNFSVKGLPTGAYTLEVTTPENALLASGLLQAGEVTYRQPLRIVGDKVFGTVSMDLFRIAADRAAETKLTLSDSEGKVLYETTFGEYFSLTPQTKAIFCQRNIDMSVELEPTDQGTWMMVAVTVKQWNLVYRNVTLG